MACSRRERQEVLDNGLGVTVSAGSRDFIRFRFFPFLTQDMPVGYGDQAATGHFAANVFLGTNGPLHEPEHFITVGFWDEQASKNLEVGGFKVPLAAPFLAHEGIQQAVIDNQTRSDHQKIAGEAVAFLVPVGVQELPDNQGLQNPRFAGSGRHFHTVFRIGVLIGPDNLGGVVIAENHIRRNFGIEVLQGFDPKHLMRIEGVQNGLFLPFMEIEGAHIHVILLKPPAEQFRRGITH